MFRRRGAFILIAFASLFVSSGVPAQTVVSRARLGNMIEDITFISTGRLANHLAFMNGAELLVTPLHPRGGPSAPPTLTKLFDVRGTPVGNTGRGLVYIPSQKLLAYHTADSGTLYLVDENGVLQGTRPMVFPGAAATYLEGMDYLPKSSPFYPDHLIVIANWFADGNQNPRIEVVRLDGTVEAEIVVQPFGELPGGGGYAFDPAYTLLALAYQAPDRMLVTLNDGTNNVWALDFNGHVIGNGPLYTASGQTNFEGIVQLPDGRIVETEFFTGQTLFFDRNMKRLPEQDRTYSVGIGVNTRFIGIAWNTDNDNHVLLDNISRGLSSVPATLDSFSAALLETQPGQAPNRLTYLPAEHVVATHQRQRVCTTSPCEPSPPFHTFIRFYDSSTGNFVPSQVDITPALGGGTALGIAYIPTTNQFAVGVAGGGLSNALVIVSRAGAFVRSMDLAPTGLATPTAVAFFDQSGGRFLVADTVNASVIDFVGGPLPGGFNIHEGLNVIGTRDFSTITTGPYAGSFGVVDIDNCELVVFTLP
jgi:hypothetical protein